MKKALFWILDHWYIPLFAIGVLLGWWLTRGKKGLPPIKEIAHELKAIEAGREAREWKAKLGAERAAEEVRKQHLAAIEKLNADQAKKAEELRQDPVALSRFLVKAGKPKS